MSGLGESAQKAQTEPRANDGADDLEAGAGVREPGASEGPQPDGGQRRRQVQEDEQNEDRDANRNRIPAPQGDREN